MPTITANPAGALNLNLAAMTAGTPGLYTVFNAIWLQLLTNDSANAQAIAVLLGRVSNLETQMASALSRLTALETGAGINTGTPPTWSYGTPIETTSTTPPSGATWNYSALSENPMTSTPLPIYAPFDSYQDAAVAGTFKVVFNLYSGFDLTTPVQLVWDFGDGTTAGPFTAPFAPSITHNFPAAGQYTVKLTATNSAGVAATFQATSGVTPIGP